MLCFLVTVNCGCVLGAKFRLIKHTRAEALQGSVRSVCAHTCVFMCVYLLQVNHRVGFQSCKAIQGRIGIKPSPAGSSWLGINMHHHSLSALDFISRVVYVSVFVCGIKYLSCVSVIILCKSKLCVFVPMQLHVCLYKDHQLHSERGQNEVLYRES